MLYAFGYNVMMFFLTTRVQKYGDTAKHWLA